MSNNKDSTPFDAGYKLLFSNPKIVQDLLEGFVKPEWINEIDFQTLEPFKASFSTDDLRERHDDSIWRVKMGQDWLYLYLLIEFQSSDDYFMACRIMTYMGLLYQDIIRHEPLQRGRKLPPVLPVVLYSGSGIWTGPLNMGELVHRPHPALARFVPDLSYYLVEERHIPESYSDDYPDNILGHIIGLGFSRNTADMRQRLRQLRELMSRTGYRPMQRSVAIWLNRLLRVRFRDEAIPELHNLNEVDAMLSEKLADWTEQWKQEGLEAGLAEGREQGRKQGLEQGLEQARQKEAAFLLKLLEKRFGPLTNTHHQRIQAAPVEQLEVWCERILDAETVEEVFPQ
ncbi:Rpn family recombination-promoting nuclease/putative transposase [Marinimicrobium agarilyticum]|uniref:Rpn family recombination-promoting nuclease/putative transposase n=1 Tax=Marinimicrobium agarilyticum TaxID=306546 RepID=UPI000410E65F|nr:Rpn family recombination-promoting nuclease/putative transposase [Marinimicrobium agarilyticum]